MRMLPFIKKRDQGQVLVIFAVAIFALLILVGLAIDGTQLFLNYTRLKRAVDAAAVAAAIDFKKDPNLDIVDIDAMVNKMKQSAVEILDMQQVTDTVGINVYTCDLLDLHTDLQAKVPDFYLNQCPKSGEKKKLVYVQASENSPTNFVTLIGIHSIPITTNAIAEAAPVDLVIVLDTSESMGRDDPAFSLNNGDFNPAACNAAHTCQPLESAKADAKILVDGLYPGYDRVAIVTFDTVAQTIYNLGDPSGAADILVNKDPLHKVLLHDDPFPGKMFTSWDNYGNNAGRFNPINPEDRNNDGLDDDSSIGCAITDPNGDRWDSTTDPNHPIPCDNPLVLDAFDWNGDGLFTSGVGIGYACTPASSDTCVSQKWIADSNKNYIDPNTKLAYNPPLPISMVSTCTGCGIRVASNQLVQFGRTNAVWVMVFLSDGVANMSDTPQTFPYDATVTPPVGVNPAYYPNGYCGGHIVINGFPAPVSGGPPNYWMTYCQDNTNPPKRHCINDVPATCPPDSMPSTPPYSPFYSVLDYAKDQTDAAALRVSANTYEKPTGNDIAIYTIMFGAGLAPQGAPLLRYMAAVGDKGNRDEAACALYETDPTHNCGQYYFARNTYDLEQVFVDIASRIYTKISE